MLLLWLIACSPVMKMPGPPGVVGRNAPDRPALPAPTQELPEAAIAQVEPPAEVREGRKKRVTRKNLLGEAAADAARYHLAHRPRGFRADCSGYVCAVYTRVGVPLSGNTRSLWELARARGATHKRKEPRLGDLAFFDNTHDRNHNGRLDDDLTHIAVVIDVEMDGTIVLAHDGTSRGRTTMRMNLWDPDIHVDKTGAELNSYLRAPGKPKRADRLSGQLWRGFATVDHQWLDDPSGAGPS